MSDTTIPMAGNAHDQSVVWIDLLLSSIRDDGWTLPADLRLAHRHANSAWANGVAQKVNDAKVNLTLHVADSMIDTGFVLIRELARVMVPEALATKLRHRLCQAVLIPLLDLAPDARTVPVDAETAYAYCLIRDRGENLPWPPDLALSHPCAVALAAKSRQVRNHSEARALRDRGKPHY